MEILESSNLYKKESCWLIDIIRQQVILAKPEEALRQQFVLYLLEELSFPKNLITVETALHTLPHLNEEEKKKVPKRRLDILCYFKHPVHKQTVPLLLVECKMTALTARAKRQLMGYNFYVKAPFIALVNDLELECGMLKADGDYEWKKELSTFTRLCNTLCHL